MTAAAPRIPSPRAAERAAAEEASAFGHAPVPPDATAAYGDHPDQVIDFYRPADGRGRPAPLAVLLHGGAWRAAYDRTHLSPLAAFLAARGFAVASVEYRRGGGGPQGAAGQPVRGQRAPRQEPEQVKRGKQRAQDERRDPAGPHALPSQDVPARPLPAGRWPDTFDDIAAALDALPGLALAALGEPAVDPHRTVLAGHSAGGHLALWAAGRHLLPPESPWHRTSPQPLRGVVALAPIADLTTAIRLRVCSDAVTDLLGGPDHVTDRIPQADPAALLPTGIATTIVHGTTDNVVPPQVSEAFADAAGEAGEEPVIAWLPGAGHFPLIDPASPASSTVAEEMVQLAW